VYLALPKPEIKLRLTLKIDDQPLPPIQAERNSPNSTLIGKDFRFYSRNDARLHCAHPSRIDRAVCSERSKLSSPKAEIAGRRFNLQDPPKAVSEKMTVR